MILNLANLAAVMMSNGAIPGPSPVAQPVATTTATATAKQYCVRATSTGSRMTQKVCRTRKDWMARGFDPLAPND